MTQPPKEKTSSTPANDDKNNTKTTTEDDTPADPSVLIGSSVGLLSKAVSENEMRYVTRALRNTVQFRKQLTSELLSSLVTKYASQKWCQILLGQLDSMECDSSAGESSSPEGDCYLGFLVVLFKHDSKLDYSSLTGQLLSFIMETNTRTLDLVQAKILFYHYYQNEGNDQLPALLAQYRTATLRHDIESQAVLLNLLLRKYLANNLYDQADKLINKTTFPEAAGNNQLARYMYYLGRIKAIQLDYTASHRYLTQATRKALSTAATAGFQQSVYKVAIIVQLLMGEIPERSTFRQPMLKKALAPYLKITSAVRVGDLHLFQETLAEHSATFQKDKTYTLILRLRHNVIKAGIRMLSLSYSRISLRDTCLKLQLDSEEDAEYVVAKAIRDGVVDAVINHEQGYMKSKETLDVYSTNEPQNAFHQRIAYCLNLHNESVQAMRYPLNAHKKEIKEVNELIEEEKKLAEELVAEEFDEDMGEF